jgi:hypothetical protein
MQQPQEDANADDPNAESNRGTPAEPRSPAAPVLHRPNFAAVIGVHFAEPAFFIFFHIFDEYLVYGSTFGTPKVVRRVRPW